MTWRDGAVVLLDQTRLPDAEVELACRTVEDLAAAIRRLAVRGAPALGVAGGYGVALAAAEYAGDPAGFQAAVRVLAEARPTAVNLRWAVSRVLAVSDHLAEAQAIETEDRAASAAMAAHGLTLVPDGARVLTHCNTGALVSAGDGTALAVVRAAHRAGRLAHLWIGETRPLLQGDRLTAWEARRWGIPHTLLADSAAGSLFAADQVDLVLVGADRICADGSVVNKIGTYPLAVLARAHGVPFVVVAPTSTIDPATLCGADVEIEQRDAAEVTAYGGTAVYNPAFDVTPPKLVTAVVTERGVTWPPAVDEPAGRRIPRLGPASA